MKTDENEQDTNFEAEDRKAADIKRKEKENKAQGLFTDAKPGDIIDMKMDKAPEKVQTPPRYVEGPIPMEKHYEIFKTTEGNIQKFLEGLDHEYYVTGFRLAYDLRDSSNEPGVYPHTLEFGHLELLDLVVKNTRPEVLTAEKPQELARKEPIPMDILDSLYDTADAALQAAAREAGSKPEIRTGLFIVLTGSYSAYAVNCCPSPDSSKRLRTTVSWGRPSTTCSGSCR